MKKETLNIVEKEELDGVIGGGGSLPDPKEKDDEAN
ncbi:hypothetical protein [Tenacibaculum phage Larrie]|nr:hypothetical protein [Tenacibaculum phage Larrie]